MDETGEGSSAAAQGARKEKKGNGHGWLSRIFGAASHESAPAPAAGQTARNGHTLSPSGGIGNLNRVRIEDVAIPRAEIIAVPVEISLEELVRTFRESGLTRLPVFEETLDSPLGFVHLKDLALKHGFACDDQTLDLRAMLRPLLFAPPSMPIGVLLQKMQTDRIHMALVIDEYGGVDGLVTIEDLIEQVLGEIEDEHDVDEDEYWVQEKPGVFICQARTPIDAFEEETGMTLADPHGEDEIDTLGGLVFVLSGRVPVRGEVICHPSGVEFEILDADPRRIKRLRVVLPRRSGGKGD